METSLLIIHALLAVVLIIVVLVQRAEGGALGIGGGSDGMSPRGSADILTRTTAIIAVLFVITSISLTVLSLKSSERTLDFEDKGSEQTKDDLLEDLLELPQLD